MGAREELIQDCVAHAGPLFSLEKTERWVDEVLAKHAHELAEEIRAERPQWGGAPGGPFFEWGAAADLIDPESGEE